MPGPRVTMGSFVGSKEVQLVRLVVHDIEEEVSRRFLERARSMGKSAEELARDLITSHVNEMRGSAAARLDEIRLTTKGKQMADPVEVVRLDRDGDHVS